MPRRGCDPVTVEGNRATDPERFPFPASGARKDSSLAIRKLPEGRPVGYPLLRMDARDLGALKSEIGQAVGMGFVGASPPPTELRPSNENGHPTLRQHEVLPTIERFWCCVMRVFEAWAQTPRFFRNVAISVPTFVIDLGLLYFLVRRAHLEYLVATVVSFLVANMLSYFLARRLVFIGTKRGVRAGLFYFLAIAALSGFALTPLMWLFVSVFHVKIILSRIATASIVGVGGYLLNLVFNFRVVGAERLAAAPDPLPKRPPA